MNIIKRLNPYTRKRLLELVQIEHYKIKDACNILGVSEFTYYYWKKRSNFNDLPNTPHHFYRKTPKSLERLVVKIRDNTGLSSIKIHYELKNRGIINPSTNCFLSESAIRAIFKRYKRGFKFDKLKRPKPVIIRYEKQAPGDMAHIDVKKIKKIKGEYNIVFKSLLSDNGSEFTTRYKRNLSLHLFESALTLLGIKHKYTRVYRPQTNGKAERMWRTLDNEVYIKKWFFSLKHREEELKIWIQKYNKFRHHLGIKGLTPMQKLLKLRPDEGARSAPSSKPSQLSANTVSSS